MQASPTRVKGWATFLSAKGLSLKGPNGDRNLIVRQNTAVPKLAALFAATPVPVWRDYLTVHYSDAALVKPVRTPTLLGKLEELLRGHPASQPASA